MMWSASRPSGWRFDVEIEIAEAFAPPVASTSGNWSDGIPGVISFMILSALLRHGDFVRRHRHGARLTASAGKSPQFAGELRLKIGF